MPTAPSNQTYSNHTRLDPPFHFFLLPIAFLNLIRACYMLWKAPGSPSALDLIFAVCFLVAITKMRLYSLRVQDRLIRLEESLRFRSLLPADLLDRISALTPGQFVALRFASDSEVPALVRRALDENLPPVEIKKAIHAWRPDDFRV